MWISPKTDATVTTLLIRTPRPDPANPLAASPLAINVDNVLIGWRGALDLFAGHSPDGQRWVVAQIDAGRWLCAPASELAIRCLLSGRTSALNLFLHSSSGMIEDLALDSDGRFRESLRLCCDLRDDETLALSQLAVQERCA